MQEIARNIILQKIQSITLFGNKKASCFTQLLALLCSLHTMPMCQLGDYYTSCKNR